MERNDERCGVWQAWTILALVFGIIVGLSADAFRMAPTDPELDCYANPSGFLAEEGWLRLWEADRMTVALLVAEKKAVIKREPSLVCRDVGRDEINRFVAHEWWWKRSQSPEQKP